MCTCRGCDVSIEVKWHQPPGATKPVLENLCNTCLAWAEVAKGKEPLAEPNARRKPREVTLLEEWS